MGTRKSHYLFDSARYHQPMLWFVGLMCIWAVVATVGLVFSGDILTGAPAWAKPLKFSLSFILYGATLTVLLPLLRRGKRIGWWFGTVIVAASVIEMIAINVQVLRGTTSHFNISTVFDAVVWATMGSTIVVLWLSTLGIGVVLWRQPLGDRAMSWAVRSSMIIGLAGMAIAFLMTGRQPGQDPAAGIVGAHSVGVADGGPGLPLVNWSTTGGDLRVSHFVGMHALQLLPLLAFALAWWSKRRGDLLDESTRTRLVVVGAAGYAGLTGLVLWQALRGQPLTHPDGLTIAAALVLLIAVIGATGWAWRAPRAQRERPAIDAPVRVG
jgi:hypothetical protein